MRSLYPAIAVLLAIGLPRIATASSDSEGNTNVTKAAVPEWVVPYEIPNNVNAPSDAMTAYDVANDFQIRHAGEQTEAYQHLAWKVLSSEGVRSASDISVSFEPSYESLAFHYIRVVRNGVARDVYNAAELRVIHDERDLNARLYHGTMSAMMFVPDVRVGDIVEYAYTITGANPVFEGHAIGTFSTRWSSPVAYARVRILAPAARELSVSKHGTDADLTPFRAGAFTGLEWEARDLPGRSYEGDTPSWYFEYPKVRYSDFQSWADVSTWASTYYLVPDGGGPAVQELVDEIVAKHPTDATRFRAAIHFVQDEVRYLGIEIGPNSHAPRLPEKTLQQRFGDCKDKSLLLATLLTELGFAATPVLVSSSQGSTLSTSVPSPYAFDHVVVRAEALGQTRWIDPTARLEEGSFEHLPYVTALPVLPKSELLDVPGEELTEPDLEVLERYRPRRKEKGETTFEVITTYRGERANAMRRILARTSLEDLSSDYLNHYTQDFPGISIEKAMTVRDDKQDNEIRVAEAYNIPEFWKDGVRDLYVDDIGNLLQRPYAKVRKAPYSFAHSVYVKHTEEMYMLWARSEVPPLNISTPYFEYDQRMVQRADVLITTRTYRSKNTVVPAEEMTAYLKSVDQVDQDLYVEYSPRQSDFDEINWTAVAVVGAIMLGVFGIVTLANRRSRSRSAGRLHLEYELRALEHERQMARYYQSQQPPPYPSYHQPPPPQPDATEPGDDDAGKRSGPIGGR